MATNTIQYQVDVSQAVASLKTLENATDNVHKTFAQFKTVIAGLAIGNFLAQAGKMADAMSDAAKAAGVSTKALLGFGEALAKNGGEFEGATTAISKFSETLASAYQGNKDAQESFAALGISLDDLRKLPMDELLTKTVEGFAGISNESIASSKAIDVFGKAMKGADAKGFASDIRETIIAQRSYADAVDSAGQTSQLLSDTFRQLQIQVLSALKPVADFTNKLLENKVAVKAVIEGLVQLGVALASLFVIGKIAAVFKILYQSLAGIGAAIAGLRGITTVAAAFGGLTAIASRLVPVLGAVSAAVIGLNAAWKAVTGEGIGWIESGLKALGLMSDEAKTAAANTKEQGAAEREVKDANEGKLKALKEVLDTYKQQGRELENRYDAELRLIGASELEAEAIRTLAEVSRNYNTESVKLQKQIADAKEEAAKTGNKSSVQMQNEQNAIKALEDALAKLGVEYGNQAQTAVKYLNAKDEETKRVNLLKFSVDQLTQSQLKLQGIYDNLAKVNMSNVEKQNYDIARSIDATAEAAIRAEETRRGYKLTDDEKLKYYEAARQGSDRLYEATQRLNEAEQQRRKTLDFDKERIQQAQDLQKVLDDTAKLTMTDMEKKELDIVRAAQARAEAMIRAEEAARGSVLSEAEKAEYYKQANENTQELIRTTQNQENVSRSWATGWKQAINDYVKAAGDGASKAKDLFGKATKGMEDLIVNFAKTGKFEWKNFVAMMLEELLRAQIQMIFAQMLGGMTGSMQGAAGGMGGMMGGGGGGMGGMGGIAGMMGGAKGGTSALGGIFDTVKGWFGGGSSSGTSAGGDISQSAYDTLMGMDTGGGGGSSGGGLWDSISNVGSSIGDFFGGWFADGGTLGAGKWGIAGEAGPELISGPANITPMTSGGGSTNVTYNINAVDAMSFKQLLASDPSFLYGVTMQGAKGVPGRR